MCAPFKGIEHSDCDGSGRTNSSAHYECSLFKIDQGRQKKCSKLNTPPTGRRDALIAFMAATAQAQAEATKAAQRAGIEHAKQSGDRAYLARKPSFTREQFVKVRAMLLLTVRRVERPKPARTVAQQGQAQDNGQAKVDQRDPLPTAGVMRRQPSPRACEPGLLPRRAFISLPAGSLKPPGAPHQWTRQNTGRRSSASV
jgi:hypothetical protein